MLTEKDWSQIDRLTSETAVDTTAVALTSMNTMVLKDVHDGTNGCNLVPGTTWYQVQKHIANNVTVEITCYRKG